jgi:hypothetical protein
MSDCKIHGRENDIFDNMKSGDTRSTRRAACEASIDAAPGNNVDLRMTWSHRKLNLAFVNIEWNTAVESVTEETNWMKRHVKGVHQQRFWFVTISRPATRVTPISLLIEASMTVCALTPLIPKELVLVAFEITTSLSTAITVVADLGIAKSRLFILLSFPDKESSDEEIYGFRL